MRILIVEDDEIIRTSLKKELESWNYEVFFVEKFDRVMEVFEKTDPHLVLLDIVLPYNNGYYWCQEIRKISKVPIVFISSRSENMDIVMAMQFGGDDYITKPIDLSVTTAKIGAILRRSYDFVNILNELKFSDVVLNINRTAVIYNGNDVELTKTEMIIMESLFRGNGEVVSRMEIMEKCWKGDDFIDDNTLAVNINRLRKKLSSIGVNDLIKTKKGIGYYLDDIQ